VGQPANLETYVVANELKGQNRRYGMEIVQNLHTTFVFNRAYEEFSLLEKKMPLLQRFDMSIRYFLGISPFYRLLESEYKLDEIGNEFILHIIRLSVMSKSSKEIYDFMRSIELLVSRWIPWMSYR
jgi:hypothetical protein